MFIEKIYFKTLQNEEHAAFHSYVSDYLSESDLKALNLEKQSADYKLKLGIEKSVLDLIQANSYTTLLEKLDIARDKPIRGFMKVAKGLLHHFDDQIAAAAERVVRINDNFSDITRLTYDKQSQAFDSYIAQLNAVSADVAILGLQAWVPEMIARNAEFLETVKKGDAETDAKPLINMINARIDTDKTYNALVDRINAFITIDGDAKFQDFVIKINGRITDFNNTVARRKGRKGKAGESDTTSTDTK